MQYLLVFKAEFTFIIKKKTKKNKKFKKKSLQKEIYEYNINRTRK